ncbi:D-aminoacyl-tRNA deacylase [Laedolimicola sp.]|uniref:D-aminoacyl-tRNA deacylase n=1 Tax=Laedolimicola sp. TaxID=2981663 RepID=UPI003F809EC2
MKFVIQRVSHASVTVHEETIGRINQGYLVLIGVGKEDTREDADRLVKKMIGLRIFADENGKINKSLKDVDGELLLVSQFTLYADCRHGNRPGFTEAAGPELANELYEYIIESCRQQVSVVETGEFGADMKVELLNDGPFTILLES